MKNIRFLLYRESEGLSQQELAERLGICKDYVNMIENNRRKPGFALAKRIADYFGTTVDNLFFCSINEQNVQDIELNIRKVKQFDLKEE